jgi:hypothetical protein
LGEKDVSRGDAKGAKKTSEWLILDGALPVVETKPIWGEGCFAEAPGRKENLRMAGIFDGAAGGNAFVRR